MFRMTLGMGLAVVLLGAMAAPVGAGGKQVERSTNEPRSVGEGAYEGLEFHCYFAQLALAEKTELRGWISGGGS